MSRMDEVFIYKTGLLATTALSLYAAAQPTVLLALLCVVIGFACYEKLRRKYTERLSTDGRVVLITGCDTGIGFELAKTLNTEGFIVIATCLRKDSEGAQKLKSITKGQINVLPLDVTSEESVQQCVAKATAVCKNTGLWALVNNAGIVSFGDIELTSIEIYKRILDVNLLGVVRVTKAFLPFIRQAKGRVVNVTSVKGVSATPVLSAYVMSKFGCEGFTDVLRLEMRRFGVKVIAVEPGNFGGTTRLWSEENVRRLQNEIKAMESVTSANVLRSYGEGHLDFLLSTFVSGSKSTHLNLDPLMTDLTDAVSSTCPQSRYMTHGGSSYWDNDVLLSVLRGYLPTALHDYLVMKFRGIPTRADS